MGIEAHAERYLAIRELLLGWSELWARSVFQDFARMEQAIPEPWFLYGASEEIPRQFALGQGAADDGRAPASLSAWARRIHELCALPRAAMPREGPRPLSDEGLTPKKKHELEAILELLQAEKAEPSRILDIGGGAGHLARHLARELGCPVRSIDRDPSVQEKGTRILKRRQWREGLLHPVCFVEGAFPGATDITADGRREWAIGLHTCGELAWEQLALVRMGYSVLNVGCCYDKVDASRGMQRSGLARSHPLALTDRAMFLAGRGRPDRSAEELVFQDRVLRYRCSLHELMLREGCEPARREAVGSARAEAYRGSFAGYVRDRLGRLDGLPQSLHALSDAAIEDHHRSVRPLVERMRFAAFLRELLARPLEIAIHLDRALFAAEMAGDPRTRVRLVQLFDPRISPRNVGLMASCRS